MKNMKIYNVIYQECFNDQNMYYGFESRLEDIKSKSFLSLQLAKKHLKELFEEIKKQDIFEELDFNKLDNGDEEYYEEIVCNVGYEYDNSINDGYCYIADKDYDYYFIAKIEEVELGGK